MLRFGTVLGFLFVSITHAQNTSPILLKASAYHTCTTAGKVTQCWGSNQSGELGNGQVFESTKVPVQVEGLPALPNHLELGQQHSCAIVDGTAYCWGSNTYGQLGDGSVTAHFTAKPIQFQAPSDGVKVNPPKLVGLSAGAIHTCVLSQEGSVFCFGRNNQGQLGNNSNVQSLFPSQVFGLKDIVKIVSGEYHNCALDKVGAIFCWGTNISGHLGAGDLSPSLVPIQVKDAVGAGFLDKAQNIFAGPNHTCAALQSQIQCWGNNASGQIRSGNFSKNIIGPSYFFLPIPLTGLILPTVGIAGGLLHSCAWHPDGIQCWGDNAYGQSGPEIDAPQRAPHPVEPLVARPVTVVAGDIHSCALLENDSIYCWGDNAFGQLGSPTAPEKSFAPVRVEGLKSSDSVR